MNQKNKILIYPPWKESAYIKELYKGMSGVLFAKYTGGMFTLLRNQMKHKPNVIHIHWVSAYFALDKKWSFNFIFRYTISIIDLVVVHLFTKSKIVWTVHNLYEHDTKHHYLEIKAKRLLAKVSAKIIVLGPSAKPLVHSLFKVNESKILITRHGTFNNLFHDKIEISKEKIRNKWNLSEKNTIYLLPGRVKKYKGCVEAISIFKEWKKSNVTLLIAGKIDSELIPLFNKLPDNIHVIDKYLSNKELHEVYIASDWVLLPYRRILTSGTLLTAMGLGKGVIAPKMGTIPDYLLENGGILYNDNSIQNIRHALEISLTSDASIAGENNYKNSLSFDWEKIRSKTEKILSQN